MYIILVFLLRHSTTIAGAITLQRNRGNRQSQKIKDNCCRTRFNILFRTQLNFCNQLNPILNYKFVAWRHHKFEQSAVHDRITVISKQQISILSCRVEVIVHSISDQVTKDEVEMLWFGKNFRCELRLCILMSWTQCHNIKNSTMTPYLAMFSMWWYYSIVSRKYYN